MIRFSRFFFALIGYFYCSMMDFQSQIRYVDRVGEGGLSDILKIFMRCTCRALEKNAVWRPHVHTIFRIFFFKSWFSQ